MIYSLALSTCNKLFKPLTLSVPGLKPETVTRNGRQTNGSRPETETNKSWATVLIPEHLLHDEVPGASPIDLAAATEQVHVPLANAPVDAGCQT